MKYRTINGYNEKTEDARYRRLHTLREQVKIDATALFYSAQIIFISTKYMQALDNEKQIIIAETIQRFRKDFETADEKKRMIITKAILDLKTEQRRLEQSIELK